MPLRDPADQVEDIAVAQPGPGNLWVWYSNGYQWVPSNFVIHIIPKINTHLFTTFPTPKGEVPITVYLYINGSNRLARLCGDLVAQLCTTYHKLYQRYSYH